MPIAILLMIITGLLAPGADAMSLTSLSLLRHRSERSRSKGLTLCDKPPAEGEGVDTGSSPRSVDDAEMEAKVEEEPKLSAVARLRLQTEGGAAASDAPGKLRPENVLPPPEGFKNIVVSFAIVGAAALAVKQAGLLP